jgi:hypothetical protein
LVGSPATLPPGADGPGGTAVTSNFYTLRDNLLAEFAATYEQHLVDGVAVLEIADVADLG